MESTKIFIDTDTDVNFIIEKILETKTEKVCLVVPDRASIFNSISTLKLLKRVIDRSDKLLLIVTLDNIGMDLANRVGIHTLQRIGDITDEIWEKIRKSKFEIIKKSSNLNRQNVVENSTDVMSANISTDNSNQVENLDNNYLDTRDSFDSNEETLEIKDKLKNVEDHPLNQDQEINFDNNQIQYTNLSVDERFVSSQNSYLRVSLEVDPSDYLSDLNSNNELEVNQIQVVDDLRTANNLNVNFRDITHNTKTQELNSDNSVEIKDNKDNLVRHESFSVNLDVNNSFSNKENNYAVSEPIMVELDSSLESQNMTNLDSNRIFHHPPKMENRIIFFEGRDVLSDDLNV